LCSSEAQPNLKVVSRGAKFWWDSTLQNLKVQSIVTHRAWVQAGRPKSGQLFLNKLTAKTAYKSKIIFNRTNNKKHISNSLQDLLLDKSQKTFWKVWKSKFGNKNKLPTFINRQSDELTIANLFANSYRGDPVNNISTDTYTPSPRVTLLNRLASYQGASFNYDSIISIDVIEHFISDFSCGKTAGFHHLTAEHLKYCHPVVSSSLRILFSLMISLQYVPSAFGHGITVPLPKASCRGSTKNVEDNRGITILPIISKLFERTMEKCILPYLCTSTSQFGF